VFLEERCVVRKGKKERKTSGVKAFSELARPLASAYVCPCGHRERAHPTPSAAINCYFQHKINRSTMLIIFSVMLSTSSIQQPQLN